MPRTFESSIPAPVKDQAVFNEADLKKTFDAVTFQSGHTETLLSKISPNSSLFQYLQAAQVEPGTFYYYLTLPAKKLPEIMAEDRSNLEIFIELWATELRSLAHLNDVSVLRLFLTIDQDDPQKTKQHLDKFQKNALRFFVQLDISSRFWTLLSTSPVSLKPEILNYFTQAMHLLETSYQKLLADPDRAQFFRAVAAVHTQYLSDKEKSSSSATVRL
jgi:hypothetical protein